MTVLKRFTKAYRLWFLLGLAGVFVMFLPYVILGKDAIFTYHDQLDGELIAYILQARHLFSGSTLPEFLNGASKTALTLPAPGFVLFFLVFEPNTALALMQLVGSLCGYIGMYLLVKELTGARFPGVVTGLLYAYLPFLPVYGLSQYGLPLLIWAVIGLIKGEKKLFAFVYAVIFALCSSLVLVGFGVVGCLILWGICEVISSAKKGIKYTGALNVFACAGVVTIVYLPENMSLLLQLLGFGSGEISHKAEYVLYPAGFMESFSQGMLTGAEHSIDHHGVLLGVTAVVLLLVGLRALLLKDNGGDLNPSQRRLYTLCWVIVDINVIFSAVSALWESAAGIALRSRLQALGAFQLNRLLWLMPCLWYLLFGCAWGLLLTMQGGKKAILKYACLAMCLAAAAVCGVQVLVDSNLKPNVQRLRNPEYGAISFGDYYALGVLDQVDAYIEKNFGLAKEDYRAVSLGMDPAAALYNGFYCLDGYSNNYSLQYKHAFRKIIAPELERNDYLRDYFDGWGNRCYLVTSECPGYFTMERNTFYFYDYRIDRQALRDLGGRFILSAAYIINAEDQGLVLLREEPFYTQDSYYQVFLYGLKEDL